MKATKILTKRLSTFWWLSLGAVASIFLLVALFSFVQLTDRFQQNQMDELQTMLVEHQQQHRLEKLDLWLPEILSAYRAQGFQLTQQGRVVYQYEDKTQKAALIHFERVIDDHLKLAFHIKVPKLSVLDNLSWHGILLITLGLLVLGGLVCWGNRWLTQQLVGIEDLAKRSHLILTGDYDKALAESADGRPRLINRALTQMLLELDDAQQQRARFDQYIRSNTFLDPETGIGNLLFLKNRLDALSSHTGMMAPGALLLIELEDLDLLQQETEPEVLQEFLSLFVSGIDLALETQANTVFARRSFNQFAIVVPQISLVDVERLAAKLLKVCLAQSVDWVESHREFFHIGVAYFKVNETKEQVFEEAEMALRAAQFQGGSNWFMYDKGAVDEEFARGTVRWRSFLEYALANKRVVTFSQPVVDSDRVEHHREVSCRLRDNSGGLVRATLFLPMATKCGLTPQIERQLIESVLFEQLVCLSEKQMRYSINLSLDTLRSRAFMRWLKTTLLEYRHLVPLLIFEVNEDILVSNIEQLKPHLEMINKMGASLCVDSVGQQLVSMDYVKVCKINMIKLHRSIVGQIHLRQENQLFIRSLIGGLYHSDVQFLAEGVESFEEWQTLQILGVSAGQGSLFSEPVEEV